MDGSSLINQQHRAHDRVNAAGTQCQKNEALVTNQVAKSNNTAASNLNQNQEHSKESSSSNREGTEKNVTTSTYINFTPISRLQLRPASRSKQNLQQQQQSSPQSGSTRSSLGSVSRAHVESCRCTKCRQLRRRKRREIPQLLYKTNRNLLIDLTLEAQGIKPTSGTNWHVLWTNQFRMHNFHALRKDQKVNQFPRTFEITRKDQLCRNILRMQEVHGKRHFDFLPESFVLPRDWDALRIQAAKVTGGDNKPFWIAKPAASACGKGIFITQDINRIDTSVVAGESNLLVSKYIHNPLLLDGRKFDLRVYVAVTSFNPLKVYIYDEGLVRLATEQYVCNSENISNRFVHLTNYSVQKHSKSFLSCPTNTNSTVGAETVKHNNDSLTENKDVDENSNAGMCSETRSGANDRLTDAGVVDSESSAQIDFEATSEKCLPNSSRAESITHCDTGQLLDSQQSKESPHSEAVNEFPEEKAHKWSFDTLRNRMARDGVDTTSLWEQIEDIVIKTLISIEDQVVAAIQMHVRYPSTNCFQLFGFDILVDDKMKPWLLEVNLSPSLACDSALDFDIKSNLISDLFNLTGVRKATNPSTTTSRDHQGTGQDDPRFELLSRQESSTRRKQVPRSAPAAAQTPEQRELARIKRAIRNLVEEHERAGRWKRAYPTRKWSKYNSYFEEVREMNVALGKYLEAARKF